MMTDVRATILNEIRETPGLDEHSLAVTDDHASVLIAGAVPSADALGTLTEVAERAAPARPVFNMAMVSKRATEENADRATVFQDELDATLAEDASIEVASFGPVVVLRGHATDDAVSRARFMADHHPAFERVIDTVTPSPELALARAIETFQQTARGHLHQAPEGIQDAWHELDTWLLDVATELRQHVACIGQPRHRHLATLQTLQKLERVQDALQTVVHELKTPRPASNVYAVAAYDYLRMRDHLRHIDRVTASPQTRDAIRAQLRWSQDGREQVGTAVHHLTTWIDEHVQLLR